MAPLAEIVGLTKTYAGGSVRALDSLTVSVEPGLIGLVGANGAGKSTLFRILLGLSQPDAGSVRVAGIDVGDDPIGVRSRLGFMPEHDCLPTDQSAADVVSMLGELAGLPPHDARQRASDILDLVGLDEARFRPIEGFSTGMRQRTKLAQALVADPHLVLLDEPTAGLDPAGRHEMLELVRRLGRFGISVLMATHLLDDVQSTCDQVVMIDGGRLVGAGRTDDLLESSGVLRVDVGGRGRRLVEVLGHTLGIDAAVLADGSVELPVADDSTLDAVVAAVADAGLPLHALSSRRATLDGLFLGEGPR
ncbi:MAG: ABC transporter ATP-binding protein [Acidimicrobiales bacterium]|nr:ABC transporter ATP-binding protein [Acidimicrobiales bacterium]